MPLTERQQLAYLLSMTAKENKAAEENNEDVTESRKVKKAKLSPVSSINRPRNKNGETQLHICTMKGELELIKSMVKQGADVNCRDNANWTPLHEACNHGHYKIAKFLAKSGAFVNAAGLEGDTPLHDASSNGHLKIVLLLLRHGADPHHRNDHGETPIDVAEGDDVIEALQNFTKEMLKDLKPKKEQTPEKPRYKDEGESSKKSNQKSTKSHKKTISNIEDFLETSSPVHPSSKEPTREEKKNYEKASSSKSSDSVDREKIKSKKDNDKSYISDSSSMDRYSDGIKKQKSSLLSKQMKHKEGFSADYKSEKIQSKSSKDSDMKNSSERKRHISESPSTLSSKKSKDGSSKSEKSESKQIDRRIEDSDEDMSLSSLLTKETKSESQAQYSNSKKMKKHSLSVDSDNKEKYFVKDEREDRKVSDTPVTKEPLYKKADKNKEEQTPEKSIHDNIKHQSKLSQSLPASSFSKSIKDGNLVDKKLKKSLNKESSEPRIKTQSESFKAMHSNEEPVRKKLNYSFSAGDNKTEKVSSKLEQSHKSNDGVEKPLKSERKIEDMSPRKESKGDKSMEKQVAHRERKSSGNSEEQKESQKSIQKKVKNNSSNELKAEHIKSSNIENETVNLEKKVKNTFSNELKAEHIKSLHIENETVNREKKVKNTFSNELKAEHIKSSNIENEMVNREKKVKNTFSNELKAEHIKSSNIENETVNREKKVKNTFSNELKAEHIKSSHIENETVNREKKEKSPYVKSMSHEGKYLSKDKDRETMNESKESLNEHLKKVDSRLSDEKSDYSDIKLDKSQNKKQDYLQKTKKTSDILNKTYFNDRIKTSSSVFEQDEKPSPEFHDASLIKKTYSKLDKSNNRDHEKKTSSMSYEGLKQLPQPDVDKKAFQVNQQDNLMKQKHKNKHKMSMKHFLLKDEQQNEVKSQSTSSSINDSDESIAKAHKELSKMKKEKQLNKEKIKKELAESTEVKVETPKSKNNLSKYKSFLDDSDDDDDNEEPQKIETPKVKPQQSNKIEPSLLSSTVPIEKEKREVLNKSSNDSHKEKHKLIKKEKEVGDDHQKSSHLSEETRKELKERSKGSSQLHHSLKAETEQQEENQKKKISKQEKLNRLQSTEYDNSFYDESLSSKKSEFVQVSATDISDISSNVIKTEKKGIDRQDPSKISHKQLSYASQSKPTEKTLEKSSSYEVAEKNENKHVAVSKSKSIDVLIGDNRAAMEKERRRKEKLKQKLKKSESLVETVQKQLDVSKEKEKKHDTIEKKFMPSKDLGTKSEKMHQEVPLVVKNKAKESTQEYKPAKVKHLKVSQDDSSEKSHELPTTPKIKSHKEPSHEHKAHSKFKETNIKSESAFSHISPIKTLKVKEVEEMKLPSMKHTSSDHVPDVKIKVHEEKKEREKQYKFFSDVKPVQHNSLDVSKSLHKTKEVKNQSEKMHVKYKPTETEDSDCTVEYEDTESSEEIADLLESHNTSRDSVTKSKSIDFKDYKERFIGKLNDNVKRSMSEDSSKKSLYEKERYGHEIVQPSQHRELKQTSESKSLKEKIETETAVNKKELKDDSSERTYSCSKDSRYYMKDDIAKSHIASLGAFLETKDSISKRDAHYASAEASLKGDVFQLKNESDTHTERSSNLLDKKSLSEPKSNSTPSVPSNSEKVRKESDASEHGYDVFDNEKVYEEHILTCGPKVDKISKHKVHSSKQRENVDVLSEVFKKKHKRKHSDEVNLNQYQVCSKTKKSRSLDCEISENKSAYLPTPVKESKPFPTEDVSPKKRQKQSKFSDSIESKHKPHLSEVPIMSEQMPSAKPTEVDHTSPKIVKHGSKEEKTKQALSAKNLDTAKVTESSSQPTSSPMKTEKTKHASAAISGVKNLDTAKLSDSSSIPTASPMKTEIKGSSMRAVNAKDSDKASRLKEVDLNMNLGLNDAALELVKKKKRKRNSDSSKDPNADLRVLKVPTESISVEKTSVIETSKSTQESIVKDAKSAVIVSGKPGDVIDKSKIVEPGSRLSESSTDNNVFLPTEAISDKKANQSGASNDDNDVFDRTLNENNAAAELLANEIKLADDQSVSPVQSIMKNRECMMPPAPPVETVQATSSNKSNRLETDHKAKKSDISFSKQSDSSNKSPSPDSSDKTEMYSSSELDLAVNSISGDMLNKGILDDHLTGNSSSELESMQAADNVAFLSTSQDSESDRFMIDEKLTEEEDTLEVAKTPTAMYSEISSESESNTETESSHLKKPTYYSSEDNLSLPVVTKFSDKNIIKEQQGKETNQQEESRKDAKSSETVHTDEDKFVNQKEVLKDLLPKRCPSPPLFRPEGIEASTDLSVMKAGKEALENKKKEIVSTEPSEEDTLSETDKSTRLLSEELSRTDTNDIHMPDKPKPYEMISADEQTDELKPELQLEQPCDDHEQNEENENAVVNLLNMDRESEDQGVVDDGIGSSLLMLNSSNYHLSKEAENKDMNSYSDNNFHDESSQESTCSTMMETDNDNSKTVSQNFSNILNQLSDISKSMAHNQFHESISQSNIQMQNQHPHQHAVTDEHDMSKIDIDTSGIMFGPHLPTVTDLQANAQNVPVTETNNNATVEPSQSISSSNAAVSNFTSQNLESVSMNPIDVMSKGPYFDTTADNKHLTQALPFVDGHKDNEKEINDGLSSLAVSTELAMIKHEFSELMLPGHLATSSSFESRHIDLDSIDTSDLLKTEKNDILSTSSDSIILKKDLIDGQLGFSTNLSSDEIISKFADCILELDDSDNTYSLREYIPPPPIDCTDANQEKQYISTISSVVSSISNMAEQCASMPNMSVENMAAMNHFYQSTQPLYMPSVSVFNEQIAAASASSPVASVPPTSAQHPPTNVHHPPTNVQHPSTNVQHPPTNVQHPPTNVQHPSTNVQQPSINVQHPPTNVQKSSTNIQYPSTIVQHPPMNVQHPLLNVHHPPMNVQHHPLNVHHPPTNVQHPSTNNNQVVSDVNSSSTNISQPLFVNTVNTVSTRFSTSDEKIYPSPKHIFARGRIYSPKASVSSSSNGHNRRVSIEPCDLVRSIIESDIPAVPDHPTPSLPPIQEDVPEKEEEKKYESKNTVASSDVKTEATVPTSTAEKPAIVLPPRLRHWREAVQRRTAKLSHAVNTRDLDMSVRKVIREPKYEEVIQKATNFNLPEDMVMRHASEKEKLRIHMIQEWCRAEQSVDISRKERGPLSAMSILYFQRDHISRKLGTTLDFKSKATVQPDFDKLRHARLTDLEDKLSRMQLELEKRHQGEIEAYQKVEQLDTILDQKNMLRQRYLRFKHKIGA